MSAIDSIVDGREFAVHLPELETVIAHAQPFDPAFDLDDLWMARGFWADPARSRFKVKQRHLAHFHPTPTPQEPHA